MCLLVGGVKAQVVTMHVVPVLFMTYIVVIVVDSSIYKAVRVCDAV